MHYATEKTYAVEKRRKVERPRCVVMQSGTSTGYNTCAGPSGQALIDYIIIPDDDGSIIDVSNCDLRVHPIQVPPDSVKHLFKFWVGCTWTRTSDRR
jgi:hypothetical protein